ncbi:undecaprenyldiphospho-muramoylpentapeptide beta-N-acetylglucosaminyltransferase [Collinsella sp. zg1085]|uniref:undecaprenyldiphospho-muramoylpentapeptide beta-N-acetylglucosaminyltransferase n=1 Tax=Collinsella sp. zg1085 TaxID=2844380 RepID=UPI00209AB91E|nr:undecaprenyldiphospho-muramoylpentapeptide beta-N-acetylglucosaminyltransferase [Collinsella sp. zg1085]
MGAHKSIAIAAGGTAGHINPALALAEELTGRGYQVRFYGEERRLEGKLVPEHGFDFFPLTVRGFDRSRPWTLVAALVHVLREKRRLVSAFRQNPELCPNLAIGFGAYVELPLMQAAAKLAIPIALHEQNSVPGLANRLMARRASLIAISQPEVRSCFVRAHATPDVIRHTGNPVRSSVLAGTCAHGRAALGIPDSATVLLVFGGSLGARHINERLVALKDQLLSIENLYVVHSTGAADFDATRSALALTDTEATRWHLCSYIDDMGNTLAAADMVLSRSGASSIAEIAALHTPAVLVPYPYATADHQTSNARYLVDAGAALMFADTELDSKRFSDELISLLHDEARRAQMRASAASLGQEKAASTLADELEKLLD